MEYLLLIGLILNFVGMVLIAISFGGSVEAAQQTDSQGRKIYLAALLHPARVFVRLEHIRLGIPAANNLRSRSHFWDLILKSEVRFRGNSPPHALGSRSCRPRHRSSTHDATRCSPCWRRSRLSASVDSARSGRMTTGRRWQK